MAKNFTRRKTWPGFLISKLNEAPSLCASLQLLEQASCWLEVGCFPRCPALGVLTVDSNAVKHMEKGETVFPFHVTRK